MHSHSTYKKLKQFCEARGLSYISVWRSYTKRQLPVGLVVRLAGSRSLYANEPKFDEYLEQGGAA